MRLIRGDSLKDAIDRFHRDDTPGRDPGARALALRQLLGRFVAVCNAVAYAHAREGLHRALKPANVMLGPYGATLVVDWGLAKAVGRRDGEADATDGTLRPSSAGGSAPTQMARPWAPRRSCPPNRPPAGWTSWGRPATSTAWG